MRVGSLCTGFGLIDLGLERAGMEITWQVEKDDYCTRVLTKHWPNVPKLGDIRDVGNQNLETVDLIAAGIPCQPFSTAGKQRGTEDDRHLWPEMSRIISELKPTWVFFENVPGIIRIFIDQAISDMEAQGYTCEPVVLPAVAFDAPHRRDRLFIVAYNYNSGHIHREPGIKPAKRRQYAQRELVASGKHETLGNPQHNGRAAPEVPGSTKERSNRSKAGENTTRKLTGSSVKYGVVGNPSIEQVNVRNNQSEAGKPQIPESGNTSSQRITTGERARWIPEPGLGRVVDGCANRVERLRGLGNGVVPQVVEHIGRIIMEANNEI